jgi:hypothetical protein
MFGKFRTIHLGDLTKNKEFELMCPNNRIGVIDLFLGLHHGQNTSNAEVIIHVTHPRVGIMNSMLVFALFPAVFSLHQLIEDVVWSSIEHPFHASGPAAALAAKR